MRLQRAQIAFLVATLLLFAFIYVEFGLKELRPVLQKHGSQISASLHGDALTSNSTRSMHVLAKKSPYKYKLCLLTRVGESISEVCIDLGNRCQSAVGELKLISVFRAVVRNMPKFLAEWLEYHVLIGVEHFFIADDCSDDSGETRMIMELYDSAGLVSSYTQLPFNDCVHHHPDGESIYSYLLKEAKDQCEWIGAMDVDEYMTLQEDLYNGTLHSFLDAAPLPAVRMPWVVMGSDGHENAPPGLLIEGFMNGGMFKFIKTLVKSNLIIDWRFSHYPTEMVAASERAPPPSQAEIDFLNTTQCATAEYPLKSWIQMVWIMAEDQRTVQVDEQSCVRPSSALFLKHYKHLSWEQFKRYRGNRTMNPDGRPEPPGVRKHVWS